MHMSTNVRVRTHGHGTWGICQALEALETVPDGMENEDPDRPLDLKQCVFRHVYGCARTCV